MTYLKLAFHPLTDQYELGPADPGAALSRTDVRGFARRIARHRRGGRVVSTWARCTPAGARNLSLTIRWSSARPFAAATAWIGRAEGSGVFAGWLWSGPDDPRARTVQRCFLDALTGFLDAVADAQPTAVRRGVLRQAAACPRLAAWLPTGGLPFEAALPAALLTTALEAAYFAGAPSTASRIDTFTL